MDILGRAKNLGLIADKSLDRLSRLYKLLDETMRQRSYFEDGGADTSLQDVMSVKIRKEIEIESKKLSDGWGSERSIVDFRSEKSGHHT